MNIELTLKELFEKKSYSEIESKIEKLGKIEDLSPKIQLFYATSKALNVDSSVEDFKVAAFLFERLYSIKKNNLEFFYNLIFTSVKAKFFEYLEDHITLMYEKNKDDPKIIEGLGKMYFYYNEMEKVTKYYEKLLKIKPNYLNIWSSYIASLNYHYIYDQKKYLDISNKIDNLPAIKIDKFKKTNKKKKIKIGFLSQDFKTHSVTFFLKETLKYANKNDFELHALSNLNEKEYDQITFNLKTIFVKWHDLSNLSDLDFIKYTRSLELDIIIDLSGHTYNNRINCLRSRCAPIQVSWLGYCNSLGIKNMDYLIADPNLIKKNEEKLYQEKILYMPNIWNAYCRPTDLPKLNNKKKNLFTYGSFNNFQKISSSTIKTWSGIIKKGDSILILKNSVSTNEKRANEILLNKFANEKVDINKIIILDTKNNFKEHLKCYNKIDLALDTFPYPGVTTSFEAISMGVPVLTMKGFNFNSRCGESINLNLNLRMLIAKNEDDYIDKAIQIQKDRNKLVEIKEEMKLNFENSPVFNSKDFSASFFKLIKSLI